MKSGDKATNRGQTEAARPARSRRTHVRPGPGRNRPPRRSQVRMAARRPKTDVDAEFTEVRTRKQSQDICIHRNSETPFRSRSVGASLADRGSAPCTSEPEQPWRKGDYYEVLGVNRDAGTTTSRRPTESGHEHPGSQSGDNQRRGQVQGQGSLRGPVRRTKRHLYDQHGHAGVEPSMGRRLAQASMALAVPSWATSSATSSATAVTSLERLSRRQRGYMLEPRSVAGKTIHILQRRARAAA